MVDGVMASPAQAAPLQSARAMNARRVVFLTYALRPRYRDSLYVPECPTV